MVNSMSNKVSSRTCIGCSRPVPKPKEENLLGDEVICDSCREEMIASLEGAWRRQSAFLDSALN